jgi:hypothetical protein
MAAARKKTIAVKAVPSAVEAPAPSASAPVSEAAKAFAAPAASLTELQSNLRSVVDRSLADSGEAYARAIAAADEAAGVVESSLAAAKAGVVAINAKTLEAYAPMSRPTSTSPNRRSPSRASPIT